MYDVITIKKKTSYTQSSTAVEHYIRSYASYGVIEIYDRAPNLTIR